MGVFFFSKHFSYNVFCSQPQLVKKGGKKFFFQREERRMRIEKEIFFKQFYMNIHSPLIKVKTKHDFGLIALADFI